MKPRRKVDRSGSAPPSRSGRRIKSHWVLLFVLSALALLYARKILGTAVWTVLHGSHQVCSNLQGKRAQLANSDRLPHTLANEEEVEDSSSTNLSTQQGEAETKVSRKDAPRFLLYRLIGNNMPPLQCHGQLLKNTRFTLDHEPNFPGCRKKWVLNNIVNRTERAALLDLLIGRGYSLEDILIRRINYTRVASFPRNAWTNVVTAQNEARNEIIEDGIRAGARWILAFDGNQFYTREAWDAIAAAANRWEEAGLKYFKVPMYRLYSEQRARWLRGGTRFPVVRKYAPVLWESQLAFRNDSDARYREGVMYGRDNKLELLDRVCGTGKFDEKKKSAKEGPADTGLCGCHKEVGNDRRQREVENSVALQCGYSIRLWYHPCAGVDTSKIFVDKKYRAGLRDKGHKMLSDEIVREVEKARKMYS